MKKPRSYKELDKELTEFKNKRKAEIREKYKGHKVKLFFRLLWFNLIYIWRWLWVQCRDWRFFVTFLIVCGVVGCTVWIPPIIALFMQDEEATAWLLGISTGSLFFWNCVPGTPYIAICCAITTGVRELFNKWKKHKEEIK